MLRRKESIIERETEREEGEVKKRRERREGEGEGGVRERKMKTGVAYIITDCQYRSLTLKIMDLQI